MAGWTVALQRAILDAQLLDSDYYMFSANGTTETSSLARMACVDLAAATNAEPAVKANAVALVSDPASAPVVISHFAFVSASSGGTQKTDWIAADAPVSLATGEKLTAAIGALGFQMS